MHGPRPGPSLRNEPLRFDQRRQREILENRRFEQRFAACVASQRRKLLLNRAVAGEHFRNGGHIATLTEDVPESAHQTFHRAVVNLRIDAVHVAGRALRLPPIPIEDKNPVFPARDTRPVKSQAEFNRHIEPRNTMGQLDAR